MAITLFVDWNSLVAAFVNFLKTFGGVILGWALGFFGAALAEKRRGKKKQKAMMKAISSELHDVALRLLGVVLLTENRRGTLDRKLLE